MITSSAETEISLAFSSASWRMKRTICWICLDTSASFIVGIGLDQLLRSEKLIGYCSEVGCSSFSRVDEEKGQLAAESEIASNFAVLLQSAQIRTTWKINGKITFQPHNYFQFINLVLLFIYLFFYINLINFFRANFIIFLKTFVIIYKVACFIFSQFFFNPKNQRLTTNVNWSSFIHF